MGTPSHQIIPIGLLVSCFCNRLTRDPPVLSYKTQDTLNLWCNSEDLRMVRQASLIQYNRCWEFGHKTPGCQAPELRCRICGDKHPELEHSRPSQLSTANNMVTNCDPPSEAMYIHCKRERRQSTNHPANWTQYPER